MKQCPNCADGRLKVTNTYSAGPAGSASRAICLSCKKVFTLATVVYCDVGDYGTGAYAVAKRLEKENALPGRELPSRAGS